MQKILMTLMFFLTAITPILAGGGWGGLKGNWGGGSGTPEPATILMILGGGLAAFGIKKIKQKKQ